jgi:hypothetical protein
MTPSVYDAIQKMRELSKLRQPFTFTFMSWSETTQSTHGVVEVRQGRLVNKSKSVEYLNSEFLEPYLDLDTMEYKRFYHPFLMTFNGRKLQLTADPNEH